MLSNKGLEKGRGLSTLDIVFTAATSAIVGAIFLIWSNFVWDLAKLALGLTFLPLIYGVWFIGATIPAYVIRKPSVALLGEFLAAVAELVYGTQFYSTVLLYGFMQGLMSELVFLATRYRRWNIVTMMLAGAAPALWAAPADFLLYGLGAPLSWSERLIFWSMYFVSGAIFAGVLVKLVLDEVAKLGVLDAFPLGRVVRMSEQSR
ncbi:MAG: hypothetical protein DRJ55_00795 [Thermoprotei archaeon]|nr:MAG: hypothetical protein DRJ46_00470 [Thermoprotei archaeon]RLE95951.1 MAG: hypothetical protein DRJ55_00795 [Thermoprotei archaeon]